MDVFISYSRKDYQVADRLCREMDKVGISYFIDRKGITGGEHFIKTISQEILSCKVFVLVVSVERYFMSIQPSPFTWSASAPGAP